MDRDGAYSLAAFNALCKNFFYIESQAFKRISPNLPEHSRHSLSIWMKMHLNLDENASQFSMNFLRNSHIERARESSHRLPISLEVAGETCELQVVIRTSAERTSTSILKVALK